MTMKPSDFPPQYQQQIREALAAAEHKAGEPARQAIAEKAETGAEKRLQSDVEAWLHHHGYWRLSQKDLDAGPPPKGWQFHMPGKAAKGNPLLPDLTLFDPRGYFLWIELKTGAGKMSKTQRQTMEQAPASCRVAYSVEDVRSIVDVWEALNDAMEEDVR